jgi:hypothetical protein
MSNLYTTATQKFDSICKKFSKIYNFYERINTIAMSSDILPDMKDWACLLCDQIDEANKEILHLYYKINTYNLQQELQNVVYQIDVMDIEISSIIREYKEFSSLL